MRKPLLSLAVALGFICVFLPLSGCHRRFSIARPQDPPIDPSDYSLADYNDDANAYKEATTPATRNPDLAKQKRNDIVYGLMGQIDVVYGAYHNRLFSSKNAIAITGDALTLGLTTASTIATHAATKTIFSALGTGFTGAALSVDKNYFAQQAFSAIGIAMQTRRDKVRTRIIENLDLDTTAYPLRAARRDLVAYLNAGTLASGLQELQEEAGTATANTVPKAGTSKPTPPSNLNVKAGDGQVTLLWGESAGTTSYNLYYSQNKGVTPASGTAVKGITKNPYTQTGLPNGVPHYFVVTAVNVNGESAPSNEASATAAAPPTGALAKPTGVSAVSQDAQVSLIWDRAPGATSYKVYYSDKKGVTPGNGQLAGSPAMNFFTHTGLKNGTSYYYVVAAVEGTHESEPSDEVSATPAKTAVSERELLLTPH